MPGSSPSDRPGLAAPPSLRGDRVQLWPLVPDDHPFLYHLATCAENRYRWRYRNQIPPFEAFVHELPADVLVQFVARHIDDASRVGHVVCYSADLRNGNAYLAAVMAPEVQGMEYGTETLVLMADYVFATWAFRKLYLEVPEFVLESLGGRLLFDPPFRQEARLEEHLYLDGNYWDMYVFAVDRDAWVASPLTRRKP